MFLELNNKVLKTVEKTLTVSEQVFLLLSIQP
jgi:hypothetical protein